MTERTLYLTELLGLKVFDLKRRLLGRVQDAALVPVVHAAQIDRFLIGGSSRNYAWMTVRHEQVSSISLDGIFLRDELLAPYHADEYMLRMERDLLDQQIIDAQGRKVVRVTDVTFSIRNVAGRDALWILDVDIGLRAIFRRLCQGVLPPGWIRKLQTGISPSSIRWELCNIVEADPQRRLRLNITTELLEKMHPADLADIVEDLSPEDRSAIFQAMEPEAAAEALSEVDPDIQAQIIESLDAERAADILEEMPADDAADVLADLEEERSEEILEEMESEPKADVEELLEYDEDSAGGMMNVDYLTIHEHASVADAIEAMRSVPEMADLLNTVFLTDQDGRLVGSLPVTRVLLARPDLPVKELVTEELQQVHVDEHAERVAELFDKYNLLTLPVTDTDGRLAGVVTADDVISLLRQK